MSAIFGLYHRDGAEAVRPDLERMQAALADHGATSGLWLQGAVGLGQRLMPFTPEDRFERQPLVSADGRCVLVSDARLDNRRELLAALQATQDRSVAGPPAVPDAGNSAMPDSALILAAYEAWGAAFVERLAGVYAFVLWDTHTETLFAARSPIIAPSLVYWATPRTFAFATMPRGLHALPTIPRALNEQRLADVIVGIGEEDEATLYQGVFRLRTGYWLNVDATSIRTGCYWRPDLKRTIRFARDEEYVEAFIDLFDCVVDDQLRSLTPIAIQMSGGLDSSSVAATAALQLAARGERLAAFTQAPRVGFTGDESLSYYVDETPFVEAIAAMHPNLDLHLVRTDGQTFLDGLDRSLACLEMPFAAPANRVWIEAILRMAGQAGRRVLLDGMQGNLTISAGGGGRLPELLRCGRWLQAWRESRALVAKGYATSTWRTMLGQGILCLLPDPLWLAIKRIKHREAKAAQPWLTISAIHPDFAAAQRVAERARAGGYATRQRLSANARLDRYQGLTNQDAGQYLSAYRAMAGVDMRSPAADCRLAEFCLALPEDQYRRDGEARWLIRRAMAGRLPRIVLENRKKGVQAADWFEHLVGAREQVAGELAVLEQSDLARRVLDLARLRRLLERMPSGDAPDDEVFSEYMLVLERGVLLGRFLCQFEPGA